MRKILFALAFLLIGVPAAHAQSTYPAAGCSLSQVQAAFTAEQIHPVNGDIITIPTCSSTWSGDLVETITVSLTIQGNTTISGNGLNCGTPPNFPTPCTATDNTVIIDNDTSGNQLWNFTLAGSGAILLRITGITLENSGFQNFHGILGVGGSNTSARLRVDHNDFPAFDKALARINQPYGYGVWDHNIFTSTDPDANGIQMFQNDDNGYSSWAAASQWGTANFTYIENNTFNTTFADDCNSGARYVFRYNVATTTSSVQSVPQSHATGSSPYPATRGCRAYEVYGNVMSSSFSTGSFAGMFQTSGTMLSWGNISTGYNHLINLVSDRDGTETYGQNNPPSGWGYCASSSIGGVGGPSIWDGNANLNGSVGSPCIDQPGRGQSDLLATAKISTYQYAFAPPWVASTSCTSSTLGFGAITDPNNHIQLCTTSGTTGTSAPAWNDSGGTTSTGSAVYTDQGLGLVDTVTNTQTWPNQMLEPDYSFDDQCNSPNCTGFISTQYTTNIIANRDYYIPAGGVQTSATSPFNGTTGTGFGTLANRPTTCTPGPGGAFYASPIGSYGVFYFATDQNSGQGEGYACSSTNTWTAIYEPYTYPNPLTGGGGTATVPSCTPTSGVVPQTVTCTNPNSGTTVMCYAASPTTPATNGTGTGCTTGTQYTTALSIVSAETLEVIAGTSTLTDSSVVSYTYTAASVTGSSNSSGVRYGGGVITTN